MLRDFSRQQSTLSTSPLNDQRSLVFEWPIGQVATAADPQFVEPPAEISSPAATMSRILYNMEQGNGATPPAVPDLVVVTGAGQGIGRAIAEVLGRYSFVLCISQTERALETAAQIRSNGGQAAGIVIDIADFEAAQTAVANWLKAHRFTRIAGVFAAATLGPRGPMGASEITDWERTFRVNVWGNLAVAHALLPVQINQRFGRLLFFAGGGAAYAYPVFPAYAASKAALVRIVENLHEDLKHQGDFASAVLAPGAVDTSTLAIVRASGAEVRTTVPIEEPTAFARAFLLSQTCQFSGRFVHVRDDWKRYLDSDEVILDRDLWKLRRVE